MKALEALKSAELGRIFRFIVVGGLATALDLVVTIILVSLVGRDNFALALETIAGSSLAEFFRLRFEETVSVIAFVIAFLVSYYGHSSVTFHKKRSFTVLWRLSSLSVFNLCLRVAIIYVLKLVLGWENYLPIVTAMVLVTVISYIFSKYWVFKGAADK